MLLVALLLTGVFGYASGQWRSDFKVLLASSVVLTVLCFVTSNRPAFTDLERGISLSVTSIALNVLVKLSYLVAAYALGHVLRSLRDRILGGSSGSLGKTLEAARRL